MPTAHDDSVRYHRRMDDFEKRWKRIHEQLLAQASGAEQRPFSSARTLFGIKSEAERKMERFAREIEREQLERLRNETRQKQGRQDEK